MVHLLDWLPTQLCLVNAVQYLLLPLPNLLYLCQMLLDIKIITLPNLFLLHIPPFILKPTANTLDLTILLIIIFFFINLLKDMPNIFIITVIFLWHILLLTIITIYICIHLLLEILIQIVVH